MRRVRIIVHAQIRSIIRVLRSLGPRSEGETAYSPTLVIKGATLKSKRRLASSDPHIDCAVLRRLESSVPIGRATSDSKTQSAPKIRDGSVTTENLIMGSCGNCL